MADLLTLPDAKHLMVRWPGCSLKPMSAQRHGPGSVSGPATTPPRSGQSADERGVLASRDKTLERPRQQSTSGWVSPTQQNDVKATSNDSKCRPSFTEELFLLRAGAVTSAFALPHADSVAGVGLGVTLAEHRRPAYAARVPAAQQPNRGLVSNRFETLSEIKGLGLACVSHQSP